MKQIIIPLFFALLGSALTGCITAKQKKAMLGGSTDAINYKASVPFDYSYDVPIMRVKIGGRAYNFLADTGAPCVISPELYAELGLKPFGKSKVGDSNNQRDKQIITVIDSIDVGGIVFRDMGAIVMDWRYSAPLRCLNFDGILGANLMRRAKWEIDYQEQIFRFSDTTDSLFSAGQPLIANFSPKLSGTPTIDLTVDSIEVSDVTFDTGSTGYLTLPAKKFKDKLRNKKRTRSGHGILSYGAYGAGNKDTSYYLLSHLIQVGAVAERGQIAEFENINKRLLGNLFLENYRVILDWETEQITFYPVEGERRNRNRSFGFTFSLENNQITLAYILADSAADRQGLQIGDKITHVNGQPVSEITEKGRCELFFDQEAGQGTIELTILRGEVEKEVILREEVLFPE